MGKIGIQMKATLENVREIKPMDPSSTEWHVKFRCSGCGEQNEKSNLLREDESFSLPDGRGDANLVMKCKFCSRTNSAAVVQGSTAAYTGEDSEKFKTIVVLDCRGIEPTECFLSTGFVVESESGTKFEGEDVDLEQGEWVGYDEKSAQSVGIYSLEYQFVKV